MVLVDLRNHGKPAELDGFFPIQFGKCGERSGQLVRTQGWDWPDVVVGHSMGGKVAVSFALWSISGLGKVIQEGHRWLAQTGNSFYGRCKFCIVEYRWKMRRKMRKGHSTGTSMACPNRWLVDHMLQLGFWNSLSQWIGSNLKTSGEEVGLLISRELSRCFILTGIESKSSLAEYY